MSFFLSSCHYIEPHCFIVHIVDGSYKKNTVLKGHYVVLKFEQNCNTYNINEVIIYI